MSVNQHLCNIVITNKTVWLITKKWRLIIQWDCFCMNLWWMQFIDGCYRNQMYRSLEDKDLKLTLCFFCVSVRNWVEFSQNIPTDFQMLTYQDKPLSFIMHTIHCIAFIIILSVLLVYFENVLLNWGVPNLV
jgi:hypothetical protein